MGKMEKMPKKNKEMKHDDAMQDKKMVKKMVKKDSLK